MKTTSSTDGETASALVPQVIKSSESEKPDIKTEEKDDNESEEDENAGLSLMEIHKKKMEKGNALSYKDYARLIICF